MKMLVFSFSATPALILILEVSCQFQVKISETFLFSHTLPGNLRPSMSSKCSCFNVRYKKTYVLSNPGGRNSLFELFFLPVYIANSHKN